MKERTRYKLFSLVYFVGFPVAGLAVGVIFAFILGTVNGGGMSFLGYEIACIVWSCVGLYAGIRGFLGLRQLHMLHKITEKYE